MNIQPNQIRDILRVNGALKREDDMRSKLEKVRKQLEGMTQELAQSQRVRNTGWFVLLAKDPNSWRCVGIVNPDLSDEIPIEWDLSLPIPDPSTVNEFQGW